MLTITNDIHLNMTYFEMLEVFQKKDFRERAHFHTTTQRITPKQREEALKKLKEKIKKNYSSYR